MSNYRIESFIESYNSSNGVKNYILRVRLIIDKCVIPICHYHLRPRELLLLGLYEDFYASL